MPVVAKRPAVRVIKRPECPTHGDTMCAYSSPPGKSYYICRAEGCRAGDNGRAFTAKVIHRDA